MCSELSQERRQALQMEVDQVSKPQKPARLGVSRNTFILKKIKMKDVPLALFFNRSITFLWKYTLMKKTKMARDLTRDFRTCQKD